MIRRVVDFALNNRLLILAFALILFFSGIVVRTKWRVGHDEIHAPNFNQLARLLNWPLCGLPKRVKRKQTAAAVIVHDHVHLRSLHEI